MPPSAPVSAAPVPTLSPRVAPARLFSRDFVLLCVSSFLFSLSMFLLFAVLPLFVVQELHGANSQVGLIMGAFAISAVLARPSSGRIVDIWSRKTGLRIGACIFCLAPALYTQAHSVALMMGLRFFHGIGYNVRHGWSNYVDLRNTRQQNHDLQQEVAEFLDKYSGKSE